MIWVMRQFSYYQLPPSNPYLLNSLFLNRNFGWLFWICLDRKPLGNSVLEIPTLKEGGCLVSLCLGSRCHAYLFRQAVTFGRVQWLALLTGISCLLVLVRVTC